MNKSKGITLISLLITVVILLILAGISLKIAVDSGLLDKTETSVSRRNGQVEDQQREIYNRMKEWNEMESN